MRILVVEDQKKMSSFLRNGLAEAAYSVDVAECAEEALSLTADHEYDLAILDVMLPTQSGFWLAKQMRAESFKNPILMLTALGGTKDKVEGLDAGADDYLTKPFEFEELLARVRALLRRNPADKVTQLKAADLVMDLVTRQVSRKSVTIVLTNKEFALLEFFLRNVNKPVSRTSISEHVWDVHFDTESNVIDVYINMLRKKIDVPFETKLINTVVGFGYVLKDPTSVS